MCCIRSNLFIQYQALSAKSHWLGIDCDLRIFWFALKVKNKNTYKIFNFFLIPGMLMMSYPELDECFQICQSSFSGQTGHPQFSWWDTLCFTARSLQQVFLYILIFCILWSVSEWQVLFKLDFSGCFRCIYGSTIWLTCYLLSKTEL